jgi:hypothetical protein
MAAAVVSVQLVPRTKWSTLHYLRVARLVLLVILGLLLASLIAAVQLQHDALKTVGADAAPSIIAAQHIKTALAGMDAELANELLLSADSSAPSLTNYDARRIEAAGSLVSAAENITYGESERGPIRTLQNGLSVYEDLVERARDLHEFGAGGLNASGEVLAAYGQAETLMDRSLLPAADDLDSANLRQLETIYRHELMEGRATRVFVALLAFAAIGTLLAVQISLSRRTQRTLNPALAVATVLTAGLTLYMLSVLAGAQEHLRTAREDAFTSIHALWQARAMAYEAKSEESRYLLDPGHAAAHESVFGTEANAIAALPAGLSGAELAAALRERMDVDGFHGYLADELNNITFPGEREAALDALQAWQSYRAIDAEVRRLEQTGHQKEAFDLSTGTLQGQSNRVFVSFDSALGRALAINQSAFDRAIQQGWDGLRILDVQALVVSLVVAGLVVLGFAPRIREYL